MKFYHYFFLSVMAVLSLSSCSEDNGLEDDKDEVQQGNNEEELQDGQELKLETTELNVPNEGGVYEIKITSTIKIYLEPKDQSPIESISPENFFNEMYVNEGDDDISINKKLTDNILTLDIKPLNSRNSKTTEVSIYNRKSKVVGSIKITQEGNGDTSIPKLGENMKGMISSIAMNLGEAFSDFNLIEQYYHYNKETNIVEQYVTPYSNNISNIWNNFYQANHKIMRCKDADAERLSVYQEYFDVFSAMQYYYMIVAWGDVPYINFVPDYNLTSIDRTPQSKIFTDLKTNLGKAIDYLEEKRNESLSNDANDYFFVSKDVARILLANIYMYEGNYYQAETLLKKVIDNGIYELDASNYNNKESIDYIFNNGSSSETIFATRYYDNGNGSQGNHPIAQPSLVPIMTYTDVILSYAECLHKNGNTPEAEKQLSKVTTAKNITVSGNNVLEKIKDAKLKLMLYTNTNFAFMKRNNFAIDIYGIEEYRMLLPIPQREIMVNPKMTQNPEY